MKPCTLQFVCGKEWEQLDATRIPRARYCGECRRAVFMVKKKHDLLLASAMGRCVGIADDNDFVGVIGDPGSIGGFDWMEDGFFEGVSIGLASPLSDERRAELRLLYPKLFDGGENESKLCSGSTVTIASLGKDVRSALRAELEALAPELRAHSEA